MILVIKVDLKKDKKVLQELTSLLEDYDILSIAWEEEAKKAVPPPGQKAGDLGTTLSQSIDRLTGGR